MSIENRKGIPPQESKWKKIVLGLGLAAGLGAAAEKGVVGVKKAGAKESKTEYSQKISKELGNNSKIDLVEDNINVGKTQNFFQENREKDNVVSNNFESLRSRFQNKYSVELREDVEGDLVCDLVKSDGTSLELKINRDGSFTVGSKNSKVSDVTFFTVDQVEDNLEKMFQLQMISRAEKEVPQDEKISKDTDGNIIKIRSSGVVTDPEALRKALEG